MPLPQVLILVETSKNYGRGMLEGIGRYALAHGPWSIFFEERSLFDRLPQWFSDWRGDGIIVRGNSTAMVRTLSASGVPVIETDARITGFGLPLVYVDNAAVARAAADHFAERGLTNLAYCDLSLARWSRLRRQAYEDELTRRGLACEFYRLPKRLAGTEWQRQRDHLMEWVRLLPKPVGLFAENDVCGQRLLDACRFMGLPVPEQVAVLGVDNDQVLCQLSTPRLSSVDLSVERMGYESAALLDKLMTARRESPRRGMKWVMRQVAADYPAVGAVRPPDERIPPSIEILVEPLGVVARQSTDILAMDDPDVASAARYIREKACSGIAVKDLLSAIPLSRRVLERRFRATLGRSPKDEIMRIKMNRARELLSGTDLSLAAIAAQTGFSSLNYLSNAFSRENGMSPRQYRGRFAARGGKDASQGK